MGKTLKETNFYNTSMKFTIFAPACLAMLAHAQQTATYQEPINRSRRLRAQRGGV